MNLFSYSDYKRVLHALIASEAERGFRSKLISAIGCQKSFFSQVLNGPVHLTPDHAANLIEHVEWNELEGEYFMALVSLSRAGSPALKSRLKKQLERLKHRATQPSESLKWPSIRDSEVQSVYYSSWIIPAIHIIVSIPNYQTPEAISKRLGIPVRRVQEVLSWLLKVKLISKTKVGFAVNNRELHLKNDSHLIEMHHSHCRNRALVSLQRGDQDGVHYSATFAMSRDDFFKLKELTSKYIEGCTQLIVPSNSEEIYCFGVDVFKL